MLPDDPGRMGWWSLGREYRDKGLGAEQDRAGPAA